MTASTSGPGNAANKWTFSTSLLLLLHHYTDVATARAEASGERSTQSGPAADNQSTEEL
jgi:hypothetical protein